MIGGKGPVNEKRGFFLQNTAQVSQLFQVDGYTNDLKIYDKNAETAKMAKEVENQPKFRFKN